MKKILSFFLSFVLVSVPAVALANETNVGLFGNAEVRTDAKVKVEGEPGGINASVRANAKGNFETNAKERADKELKRRADNLNQLKVRLDSMGRLSAEEKARLQASLTAQIDALTALKARIEANTDDTAALKADVQSITKGYRVYALVLPQARIAASADRIKTIVGQMQTLGIKLETRINSSTSTDMTAMKSAYADMQAKLADAKVQADAAVSLTVNLKPDNGDEAVAKANAAAVKEARAKIEVATKSLKAAREDVMTILKGLKVSAKGSAEVKAKAESH